MFLKHFSKTFGTPRENMISGCAAWRKRRAGEEEAAEEKKGGLEMKPDKERDKKKPSAEGKRKQPFGSSLCNNTPGSIAA